MNIKRRAIEIWMSDKKTQVIVRSPTMEQFRQYLDSFGVVQRIGKAFQAIQSSVDGSIGFTQVQIGQADLDEFYPLLAMLSTYRELNAPLGERDPALLGDHDFAAPPQPVTTEDYNKLPVDDGMAVMFAYVKLLAPETLVNPTSAESEAQTTPPAETAAQPS